MTITPLTSPAGSEKGGKGAPEHSNGLPAGIALPIVPPSLTQTQGAAPPRHVAIFTKWRQLAY